MAGWGCARCAFAENQSERNAAVFDAVWEQVNEAYYDPEFSGVDWEAQRDSVRPLAVKATSGNELERLLNHMLGQLGVTHLAVLGLGDDERLFLASSGDGYSGIRLSELDDKVVALRVFEDSPADAAGVVAGMEVRKISGRDVYEIRAALKNTGIEGVRLRHAWLKHLQTLLDGRPEKKRTLELADLEGNAQTVRFKLGQRPVEFSEQIGYLPSLPLEFEHRKLENGIHYIHFNLFLPEMMSRLRPALQGVERGLVLDLRGNEGGVGLMANGVAGLLISEQTELGRSDLRDGWLGFVAYPQQNAFLGPVAVLVDSGTASTAELLAGGLQQAERGRVFGERTSGAAMLSLLTQLPGGGKFQFVIGDLKLADGSRIDGTGVTPDVSITTTREALFAGEDPVLEAAQQWLDEELAQP
ncbi:MAG: S41 family peptidase [Opitutales bacterium]